MKDPMYKLDKEKKDNVQEKKNYKNLEEPDGPAGPAKPRPVMNYGMDKGLNKGMEATPLEKHSSGIGPANLGGPGMKSHVHACGTPKMSSGLNDGHEDTALPNLGFIKAKTLENNPDAKTMTVDGKEMPIKP